MKASKWQIWTGISLVGLSVLFYIVHYLIFRDVHQIFINLLSDIAFAFIQVLLVGLIINHLLTKREKQARMEKLNMVIGVFFSEIGNQLLSDFSKSDPNIDIIREELIITRTWSDEKFKSVIKRLKTYDFNVKIDKEEFAGMRNFLLEKSEFLLRILENPTLMEHESFTDLLQAVFHLTEELKFREHVIDVPKTDLNHLNIDAKRVYTLIIIEWLNYMDYLEFNYPYLFSLAIRTNPFDKNCSVIVNED